jgi:hypothetical protein
MLLVVAASFRKLALEKVGSETLVPVKDPSLVKQKQFTIIILLCNFNNKKSTDLATEVSITKESVKKLAVDNLTFFWALLITRSLSISIVRGLTELVKIRDALPIRFAVLCRMAEALRLRLSLNKNGGRSKHFR